MNLECPLPDATHTLLGDITTSPSKGLDVVTGVVALPELHRCLLSVLVRCSDGQVKRPPQEAGHQSCYDILIQVDQTAGVWRERHLSDIGMKITNKRRISGSIINKNQNLERFLSVLFLFFLKVSYPPHGISPFAGPAVQEEELGHPRLLMAPLVSTLAVCAH